jgi:Glycosyl transferase family 64 domain
LDLLEIFLGHYAYCQNVEQIQVVWSDQKAAAPSDWLAKYPAGKVVFETHSTDSLNNRFRNLTSIPTEVRVEAKEVDKKKSSFYIEDQ